MEKNKITTMKPAFNDEVKKAVKNWWMSLLLGFIFVIMALWLMFDPAKAYGSLVIISCICIFSCGTLDILFSIFDRKALTNNSWYLMGGIIDLIFLLFIATSPIISAMVLPSVLALWVLFKGVVSIGYSVDFHQHGLKGWGWYLSFGVLAIFCSFIILWQPLTDSSIPIIIIAFTFLFMGFFRIMLSFGLKNLHKTAKNGM